MLPGSCDGDLAKSRSRVRSKFRAVGQPRPHYLHVSLAWGLVRRRRASAKLPSAAILIMRVREYECTCAIVIANGELDCAAHACSLDAWQRTWTWEGFVLWFEFRRIFDSMLLSFSTHNECKSRSSRIRVADSAWLTSHRGWPCIS